MVKILSSACTTFFPNYQLFLPMDIGVNISKSAPVRVISKLLEGLDYRYLMQVYSKIKVAGIKLKLIKCFLSSHMPCLTVSLLPEL